MSLLLVPVALLSRGAILELLEAALTAEPDYLPQVSTGSVALSDRFDAKTPNWARAAYAGPQLVGHVSVRRNDRLSHGGCVPPDLVWELGRLAVAPSYRRSGVASRLVAKAMSAFGTQLWATCVAGGGSHQLFTHLGRIDFANVVWDNDLAPGVAVRSASPGRDRLLRTDCGVPHPR